MAEFQVHMDFTNKYRIKYPADWQRQALSPTTTGFFAARENPADVFSENVNVSWEETPVSLVEYVDFQVGQLKAISKFQLISRDEIRLAGHPAQQIEIRGEVGPIMAGGQMQMVPLQWLCVCVLKDKRAYCITYSAEPRAYDKYMPQVQEMLDSLELA